jgi:hypothetical protein
MHRRPSFRLVRAPLAGVLAAGLLLGCGASINALYEGDVRFEHCMALDSRSDVKPTIRRACWEEWTQFYTFGQTRDRVDYARMRQKQLRNASDFDEGDWSPPPSAVAAAAPEPTSALAPPPMTLSVADAGAPDAAEPAPSSAKTDGTKAPPSSECSASCEQTWAVCRQDCKTPACDKTCTGKYKRCMRRCF